ncbi:ATP-binding cassette, subfamily C, CydC [Novosphingobium sp. CF614]|uniref:amino acid ABC transporter ATP-binding/permease protein n=1 Tax=Novosphingobium sp. CF614 TaxID=1884364 RepID=UPI0008EF8A2E|nr:ATP-binding cassette domain-containing protein [Novosphingobium sp. CF614]SFG13916.1 ATP-binding cassette, subfamily C, CydC [Novosphingobium sp. CF614]
MTDRRLEALLDEVSRPYRGATRLAMLCAACAAIAGILLLGLAGWFITGAALAGAAGIAAVQAFNYLLPSAAIRLLAIGRTVTRYGERLYGHKAALSALALFRIRLFETLIAKPIANVERGAGDLAALLLEDVAALEDRFVRAPGDVAALVGTATALALAMPAGPMAMYALAAIVVAVLVLTRLLARRWLPARALRIQQDIAALKQLFVEYAAASPEIAAYALGRSVETQLLERAAGLDAKRTAFARAEAVLAAIVTGAGGLAMAAMLGLSTAALPITLLAALAAAGAIETLGASVRSSGREAVIAAGLARLAALVSTPPMSGVPGPLLAGDQIRITGNNQMATLKRGDRLSITGRSGSGKTSLLEYLAGQRTTGGNVEIDGHSIAHLPPDTRRALFGFSPQNAQMLAGTIADNLRIARIGLTDEALWQALEVACLADDVRALPEGLATWVGDGGIRLSGGQRKRLSLARALLADRPWLLLDEPSEGLDPQTEARMRTNLDEWLNETGAGLVLVTHRTAMLSLADQHLALPG